MIRPLRKNSDIARSIRVVWIPMVTP
jgi:hypothetical protein